MHTALLMINENENSFDIWLCNAQQVPVTLYICNDRKTLNLTALAA